MERRLALARDADAGSGTWHRAHNLHRMTAEDAAFVEAHGPRDAIRRYDRDLKVLERHRVVSNPDGSPNPWCDCGSDYYDACPEIVDLADVYQEVSDVD